MKELEQVAVHLRRVADNSDRNAAALRWACVVEKPNTFYRGKNAEGLAKALGLVLEELAKRPPRDTKLTPDTLIRLAIARHNEQIIEIKRVAAIYRKHVEAIDRAYGCHGLVQKELGDEFGEINLAEVFDDDNFKAALDSIRATTDPFKKMAAVNWMLDASVDVATSFARRLKKLRDRKRLGSGSLGEQDNAERLIRKTKEAEDGFKKRVALLLTEFGDAQARVLGALSGASEMMARHITDAKLEGVAKVAVKDTTIRTREIQENNDNAKGIK